MRIGIFSECYLPTLNGVVVSINTFKKEMEKLGHEYFIFAPETDGYKDQDRKHIFRYPSITWPGQKNYPLAMPFFTNSITEKIEKLDLDIIHAQHLFTMGKLGLRIARRLQIPIVYTYHTLITEYVHYLPLPAKFGKHILTSMSRNFCNSCDQIITPSPSMSKILKGYGVKTPIESIPTGIDIDTLKNKFPEKFIRAKWDIPENRKILLYLSRVAKEKNLKFLLLAFADLLDRRRKKHNKPDVHLILAGGGPELEYFKKMAQSLHIENYITFTGMLDKEIANRYFGAAYAFVFPSITETQGIVITEAMAAGTPVVAIDKMGPSDLVKNGKDGFLTGLKKTDFNDKIEKLLDSESLRNEMGKNARQNAEFYSAENCAKKMENIYEQTIQQFEKIRQFEKSKLQNRNLSR